MKRGKQIEEENKINEEKRLEEEKNKGKKKKSKKNQDMDDGDEEEGDEEEEEEEEGEGDEGEGEGEFEGIQSIIENKKKEALKELEKYDPLAQEKKPDLLEINGKDWDMDMSALHFAIFFGWPKGFHLFFFYFSFII